MIRPITLEIHTIISFSRSGTSTLITENKLEISKSLF